MKKLIFTTLLSVFSILTISAQTSDVSVAKIYQNYLGIKTALAADNSDQASKAADAFIKSVSMIDYKVVSEGNQNVLRSAATKIAESRSIEAQRSSFKGLSKNMMILAEQFKLANDEIYLQYCPMADASWLSAEKEIRNPYYGSAMLKCGSVKKVLK